MATPTSPGYAIMQHPSVPDQPADITIICDGKHFKAHLDVLAAHSTVLAQECANLDDGNDGSTLHIKNFDAATVGRMLEFFYEGDFQYVETSTKDELLADLFCCAIGEAFGVDSLVERARNCFRAVLITTSIADYIETIRVVLDQTTSQHLCLAVGEVASDRIDELARDEGFIKYLADTPELSHLSANLLKLSIGKRQACLSNFNQTNEQLSAQLTRAKEDVASWQEQATKHGKTLRMSEQAHKAAIKEMQQQRAELNIAQDSVVSATIKIDSLQRQLADAQKEFDAKVLVANDKVLVAGGQIVAANDKLAKAQESDNMSRLEVRELQGTVEKQKAEMADIKAQNVRLEQCLSKREAEHQTTTNIKTHNLESQESLKNRDAEKANCTSQIVRLEESLGKREAELESMANIRTLNLNLQETLRKCDVELQSMAGIRAQALNLQTSLTATQRLLQNRQQVQLSVPQDLQRKTYVLDSLVALFGNLEQCRNTACDADFPWYLQRDVRSSDNGQESVFMIRCADCGCRHYNNLYR